MLHRIKKVHSEFRIENATIVRFLNYRYHLISQVITIRKSFLFTFVATYWQNDKKFIVEFHFRFENYKV